ncbi:uncharacterized protein LOC135468774 [Liolophura sinensis]|uniref:uncharacterized protein LOC135468774 n=1 Tax=Liolophura sinensis TaxID=3198878 RepID=UPI00315802E5
MAGLRTASTWLRISLVMLILAIILFVVGFATVYWIEAEWYKHDPRLRGKSFWSYGLWEQRICMKQNFIGCYNAKNSNQPAWFHAAQAMECLGLICLVLAFIILILYTCVTSMRRRNPLILAIILTFLAVAFIVIGVAIFVTKFDTIYFDVGWSLALAIAAAVCTFVSGILSLLELCTK